jgi:uroporphyrinogen-III decarboxylase
MTRREQVKKAIRRQGPDYVPLFIFDGDRSDSDLIQIDLERFYLGPDKNISEWGFQWDSTDTKIPMGTPVNPPISSWEDFEQYQRTQKPDPFDPARFADVKKIMAEYGPDRYYMGSLYLTGFTIMSFIRGYGNLLEDFYLNRRKAEELTDLVFGVENDIIRQMKAHGFDAVSLWDDWGTQTGLILDPKMWREIFKPRYIRQVEIAHACGLDVFFHTCGYVYEIIPDLIEIGYDLLNLGQTDINNIEQLGKDFGGKICFVAPISYQTTSLSGTVADIYSEGRRLIDSLGRFDGGLIALLIYYQAMGMSEENYRATMNVFKEYGRYLTKP